MESEGIQCPQSPWEFNWELGTYLPYVPLKIAALTNVIPSGWAPRTEDMGKVILQHIQFSGEVGILAIS